MPVALIAAGLEHADDSWLGRERERQRLFSNTKYAVAAAQIRDIPALGGIFALGCVLPHVPVERLMMMQATGVSGEWSPLDGFPRKELFAVQFVPSLGFRRDPRGMNRPQFIVAASAGMTVTSWVHDDQTEIEGMETPMETTMETAETCACQIAALAAETEPVTLEQVRALITEMIGDVLGREVVTAAVGVPDAEPQPPAEPESVESVDTIDAAARAAVAALTETLEELRTEVAELVAHIAMTEADEVTV